MGIKNNVFVKKSNRILLTLCSAILGSGNLAQMNSGTFQDGAPLVTHSQILSTFQDGGRVKFSTLRIVVDVKIPTHLRFSKSNSPGLQTIDRCIKVLR